MQNEDLDLARRLFAVALIKLEDSTVIATRGQSSGLPASGISEAARLRAAALDVAALAEAIAALTREIAADQPRGTKPP